MNFTLRVRIRKAEGALVRLLGLATRRNYDILGFTARLTPDGKAFDVRLEFLSRTPEGNPWYRAPQVLARMAEKLYDVESVELVEDGIKAKPPAARSSNGPGNGSPRAEAVKVKAQKG